MENKPLPYVRESKLGVVQIWWASELVPFDFDIKHRTHKLNKAADTLGHHPFVPSEMDSESELEEYETISYARVCEKLENIINGEELPRECKVAIKERISRPADQDLELHTNVIEALIKMSPSQMKEVQQSDPFIFQVVQYIKAWKKPKLS